MSSLSQGASGRFLQALLLNVKVRCLQLFRTLAIVFGTVPATGASAMPVFIWSPSLGLINSISEGLGLQQQRQRSIFHEFDGSCVPSNQISSP